MKRENSLVNAIARAKRNMDKYSPIENILDASYEYYLRKEDEIPELVKAINKYAEKHFYPTVELEDVLKCY